MSIVRLKKVTLVGRNQDKQNIVAALQGFGELHIIDKDKPNSAHDLELSPKAQKAYQAIHFLQRTSNPRRALKHARHFDFDRVVAEVLALKDQIRDVADRLEALNDRIVTMKAWGDFNFPPESYVDHFRFWFYRLPVKHRAALEQLSLPWKIVGNQHHELYVVLVSADEPDSQILPVAREHLGSLPLSTLLEQREQTELRLEELQVRRQQLCRYLPQLQMDLDQANNRALFQYVLQQTQDIDTDNDPALTLNSASLFLLKAWLPVKNLMALTQLSQQQGFAFVAEDPQADDSPPTLLQPVKGFRAGADLASVYQLPDYRSWDPSVHLYLSFTLFFAMILSDAGYAVLLGGFLALSWKRLSASMASLLRFMLSGAAVWGVMVGSYFGYEAPPDSFLAPLKIIDLNNYDAMMTLSVLIGVCHIVIANLSMAWNYRHERQKYIPALGWIGICLGGCAIWLQPAVIPTAAVYGLLAVSVMGLLGFSSDRPVNSIPSALLRLTDGLLKLTGLSKLFGDVLSYMRLFALGLASASLALTFNNLAHSAYQSDSGLSLVTGTLIFLAGHIINLALGIMSGVVHGLRLNFIEFYNWGEPGEGYAFSRFSLQQTDVRMEESTHE
ncbi:V-type ATP synthase subunit I [Bacterioplanoides sp. SCSIO 12839]|uniref:V-type ATP synthase subunit I n=1 Tax=Bacterioplanoides sp. SCSIO 12839 TaxID=2829569 RepID=UPI0021059018|nr:V-type ATP synthase subunit I [Bacterioplanoides sp. SCSIO 12839]UTW47727.1 V-type ATP synthase subunit I [Bacterioplanoides sp. SCSIO 12839]